jgi:hypothetical protein
MGPDCLRKQKALRCVSSAAAGTPAESPSFRAGSMSNPVLRRIRLVVFSAAADLAARAAPQLSYRTRFFRPSIQQSVARSLSAFRAVGCLNYDTIEA